MIIGRNEIRLNEATMMRVLRTYFNDRIGNAEDDIEVTSVVQTSDGLGVKWFAVSVQPKGTKS